MRLILAATLIAALAAPATAQQRRTAPPHALPQPPAVTAEYDSCITRAAREPAAAFDQARAWRARGGGEAASHCAAVAMWNRGQSVDAAELLEQIGFILAEDEPRRGAIALGQAARAWLDAGRPDRMRAAVSQALRLSPDDVDLLLDRAEAEAGLGRYWEAIDDLNRAIDLSPRRGEALALRAAAYRHLNALDLALDDAERATLAAPQLPDGFLERGIVHRLRGNANAARADFLKVLTLDSDGPAGEAVRAEIEKLELSLMRR